MSRRLSSSARPAYRWRNLRTSLDGATINDPVRVSHVDPVERDVGDLPWWWVPARSGCECVLCGAAVPEGSRVAFTASLRWTLCPGCVGDAELEPKMSRRMIAREGPRGAS